MAWRGGDPIRGHFSRKTREIRPLAADKLKITLGGPKTREIRILAPNKLKITFGGPKTREMRVSGPQISENELGSKSGPPNTKFISKNDDFWPGVGWTPSGAIFREKREKYAPGRRQA